MSRYDHSDIKMLEKLPIYVATFSTFFKKNQFYLVNSLSLLSSTCFGKLKRRVRGAKILKINFSDIRAFIWGRSDILHSPTPKVIFPKSQYFFFQFFNWPKIYASKKIFSRARSFGGQKWSSWYQCRMKLMICLNVLLHFSAAPVCSCGLLRLIFSAHLRTLLSNFSVLKKI